MRAVTEVSSNPPVRRFFPQDGSEEEHLLGMLHLTTRQKDIPECSFALGDFGLTTEKRCPFSEIMQNHLNCQNRAQALAQARTQPGLHLLLAAGFVPSPEL